MADSLEAVTAAIQAEPASNNEQSEGENKFQHAIAVWRSASASPFPMA